MMKKMGEMGESLETETHFQENSESTKDIERRIRILCVDDERCSIELTKEILSIDHCFEIDGASSVEEALTKMKNNVYDAIVSDYEMPQKNGLDFLKELREQKIEIPFILFTGKNREGIAVNALNLGADSYINKQGSPEAVYCELSHAITKIVERKKSTLLLAKSESKYRTLVENSLQGMMILLPSPLRLVFANEAIAKILGYSRKELMAFSPEEITKLVYFEDRTVYFNRMEKRLRGEKAKSCFDFRAVRKDGSVIWIEALSNRVEYEGRIALQGIFLNINERKKDEEIVRKSEARYRELANFLPDIVFEADLAGKITFFSQRASDITGFAQEEFKKGLTLLSFVSPEDLERAKTNIEKSQAGEGLGSNEYKLLRRNGTIFPALVRTTPITFENKVTGLRGLVIDITEHKKAEEEVQKQKNQAVMYLNIVGNIVLALDNNCKITLLNKKGYEVLGFNIGELDGKDWVQTCLPHEIRKELKCILRKSIMEKKIPEYYENSIITKNGEKRIISWHNSLIIDDENRVTGVLSSGQDVTEQKRTVAAMIESEEKFRNLAEKSPNMIFINHKGQVVYANQKCEDITGYTKKELYSKEFNFLFLCAPEFTGKMRASYDLHLMGKEVPSYEFSITSKKGNRIDAIISTKLIDYCGDKAILGIVTDISSLKKTEYALKESEEKYRLLVEHAHDGIIAQDPDYNILFINRRMTEILGFSEKEIVGKNLFCFVAEKGFDQAIRCLNYCKRGTAEEIELELVRKDGQTINALFSSSSIKDKAGNYVGNFALVSDITVRKKMEEKLKQERANLENVTENIGAGLTLIGKDYRILWANNFLKELNGPLENKRCYSTFNCSNKICSNCGAQKVFNGALYDSHEYFNRELSKRGLPCWFEIIATPIKDSSGQIVAALELTVDITEKKRMQSQLFEYSHKLEKLVEKRTEELRQAQAKLVISERLAAIGELAGMVGHDLRNPLTGIKNAAYFLKKNCSDFTETKSKQMLEIIDKSVDHSDRIINDLMEYSREIHLDLQEISPRSLLLDSLQMINVPNTIKILNNLNDEPKIKVDSDRIMRVFINLIKNAIDAMPNGGTLKIESKFLECNTEISFIDQGTGITKEILPKIFSPLFTTKAQGMGFGLAICKRYVEAHHGKIIVQSSEGKGTTFTLILPNEPRIEIGVINENSCLQKNER